MCSYSNFNCDLPKVILYENKFDEYIAYLDIDVYSSNALLYLLKRSISNIR